MVLRLCMNKEDAQGMKISYEFRDASSNLVVAKAADNINEYISLWFDNKEYQFPNYPKFVVKPPVNFKYPLSSKRKKTIGFHIMENGECCAKFYGEAATCRKKGLFKKNIGFTVFEFAQEVFMLFRVGFSKENSHFYCLYDNNGSTVAIIERHSFYEDNCKATIYVEDSSYITIALLACTEEIVSVANSGNRDEMMDTSAGHYISMLDEEKELLDRSFLERVKLLS